MRSRLGVVKVSPSVAGPGPSGAPRYTLEGLSGVKRVGAAEWSNLDGRRPRGSPRTIVRWQLGPIVLHDEST